VTGPDGSATGPAGSGPRPADEPPDHQRPTRRRGPEDERRAAVRRFALEHHPDRGGDPETFAAGRAALRAGRATDGIGSAPAGRGAELRFHRRRGMLATLVDRIARRVGTHQRPPRVT
ncbi:MAG: hypothetical protein ACQSGP_20805, partial [Frankia sp.]